MGNDLKCTQENWCMKPHDRVNNFNICVDIIIIIIVIVWSSKMGQGLVCRCTGRTGRILWGG